MSKVYQHVNTFVSGKISFRNESYSFPVKSVGFYDGPKVNYKWSELIMAPRNA